MIPKVGQIWMMPAYSDMDVDHYIRVIEIIDKDWVKYVSDYEMTYMEWSNFIRICEYVGEAKNPFNDIFEVKDEI